MNGESSELTDLLHQFQLITRRQRNHETFVQSLIYPKTISSKHLAHGKWSCRFKMLPLSRRNPFNHVRTKFSSWKKISSTSCRLKRNHAYFTQVQGQMGVTGCEWCDFIVYTSKGLYVERIQFEPQFGVLPETNLPNIILNITLKLQQ